MGFSDEREQSGIITFKYQWKSENVEKNCVKNLFREELIKIELKALKQHSIT